MAILAAFTFTGILVLLLWVAFALMNFWVWKATKAKGNLVMLIGAGLQVLQYLVFQTSTYPGEFAIVWLPILGVACITAGFYLSVKQLVAPHLEAWKKKASQLTSSSEKGGTGSGS